MDTRSMNVGTDFHGTTRTRVIRIFQDAASQYGDVWGETRCIIPLAYMVMYQIEIFRYLKHKYA